MTYQALYRKWRPLTFDDVVGQEHISTTLKNEIKNNRIAHAYLFCGTRGTGKTSSAKIFARALNCTSPNNGNPCNVCDSCVGILDGSIMDVFEMDAASNNGVDNIREIRDEVAYTPAHSKYKIYIIDEAHMLSTGAFNALLKTLEEPPPHVIFILATTEPHKLPATILSRTQRFDFRRITINDIAGRLLKISEVEGINITPDAAEVIAATADGSMRDAVSALDQCAARNLEQIRAADVSNILGIADKSNLFNIAAAVADNATHNALLEIGTLIDNGAEVLALFEDLISHYRNLLICRASGSDSSAVATLIDKTADAAQDYITQAAKYSNDQIISNITVLSEYMLNAKWMTQPRVALEMALVRMNSTVATPTPAPVAQPSVQNPTPVGAGSARPQNPPDADNGRQDAAPTNAPNTKPVAETIPEPPPIAEPPPEPAPPAPEPTPTISTGNLWADALATIKSESKQLFGFLAPANVSVSGNSVEIRLSNSIAIERVGSAAGVKYLEDLFAKISGEKTSVTILNNNEQSTGNFGEAPATSPQPTGIDEIIGKQETFGNIMQVE